MNVTVPLIALTELVAYARVMADKLQGEYSDPEWKEELRELLAALDLPNFR